MTAESRQNRPSAALKWREKEVTRPEDRHIQIDNFGDDAFHEIGPNVYEVGESALVSRSMFGRYGQVLKRSFLGRPLRNEMAAGERLSKISALAILSSDALSSVAYGPEAALFVLAYATTAGAANYLTPIGIAIALLIFVVALSYRQTIHAYPNGGGSYIVAKDNLGTTAGLVAAAALLIDYILTVSVSVVSGVANFLSIPALQSLQAYALPITLGVIVLMTIINLRGIRESGLIFTTPVYFFIVSLVVVIGYGLVQMILGNVHHVPFAPENAAVNRYHSEALSLFLILQAFAAGCSAMTGVEAISNGVPVFKRPESKNAATTLVWMAGLLIVSVLGVSLLLSAFGILPRSDQTAISQLSHALFDDTFASWFYYVIQISTALILVLAANTSYADFPRLASLLARDGFVPRLFANRGDRLAFSSGIIALAGAACILVLAFPKIEQLIPLYAVGVFLAFTLSQSGMVIHWQRLKDAPNRRRSQMFNVLGALATGVVLVIIAVTKFAEGAWLVILLIPLFVGLFRLVSTHYRHVTEQLKLDSDAIVVGPNTEPCDILVLVSSLNKANAIALNFARSLSSNVTAVHCADDPAAISHLQQEWQRYKVSIPLVILESPYRSVTRPLLAYIDRLHERAPDDVLLIVLPEFVARHWWEVPLHNLTAFRLKNRLLPRKGIAVLNVPYQLEQ